AALRDSRWHRDHTLTCQPVGLLLAGDRAGERTVTQSPAPRHRHWLILQDRLDGPPGDVPPGPPVRRCCWWNGLSAAAAALLLIALAAVARAAQGFLVYQLGQRLTCLTLLRADVPARSRRQRQGTVGVRDAQAAGVRAVGGGGRCGGQRGGGGRRSTVRFRKGARNRRSGA